MRATGTLLVTISLMFGALFVGSAQAAEAEWLLETETLTELELEKEKAAFGGGPLSIHVSSLGLTIECGQGGGTGEILPGGSYGGTVDLTECEVEKAPSCEVKEPLELDVSAEFSETDGHLYDTVGPLEKGQPLGTVFLSGVFCGFSKELKVTGSIAAEASTDFAAELPMVFSQELSEAIGEEGPTLALLVGGKEAFLDGELTLGPNGAHGEDQIGRPPQTRLCKTDSANPYPCPAVPTSKIWPANTPVEMVLEEPVKFIFNFEEKCTEGVFQGRTEVESARPLRGTFETMYFAGCTRNGNECRAAVGSEPWPFFFWRTVIYGRGTLSMPYFYEVECGGLTCFYQALEPSGIEVIGGEPMKARVQSVSLIIVAKGSDALCEDDALLKGEGTELIKFKFEEPTKAYVTR